MNFHIVTLFPEAFDSYLKESVVGRAIKEKKIKVSFYNPRKFVTGKYKKVWPDGNVSQIVDDRPYGGGPGMVIRAEPVLKAVENAVNKINSASLKLRRTPRIKIINFYPSAKKFTTEYAKKLVRPTKSGGYTDIILICGRYEGIDARVDKVLKDLVRPGGAEKISIGDYVLTGGELPAMVVVDCVARQIPGVLGKFESLEEERVSSSEFYTRPEVLEWPTLSKNSSNRSKKYKVPKVLLSGDHKKIEEWKSSKKSK